MVEAECKYCLVVERIYRVYKKRLNVQFFIGTDCFGAYNVE